MKGLQMADHFKEVGHFTDPCLVFIREMKTVTATYEDMQKKAKQSKITSFFTTPCVFPPSSPPTSITLTTFQREHRRHPDKQKTQCFMLINHK
jgi:hypothetical protein